MITKLSRPITVLWSVTVCLLLAGTAPARAEDLTAEVCVVGGGSGGMAAALAAAREGVRVILVEKQAMLGGTSTAGLVSMRSGPSDAIAREIYETLHQQGAAGVARRRGKVPYHCWTIDPELGYETTLQPGTNRVVFDPQAMSDAVHEMLRGHGVRILLETTFHSANADGKRVHSIAARAADGTETRIRADVFIDATGGVHLCRAVGCETAVGTSLNGITLCYRVRKAADESPAVLSAEPFQRTSCNHQLPNGDRIINMLPTLPGNELLRLGYDGAMAKCQSMVLRHWAWLRQGPGAWQEYRFDKAAALLGIRESHRVVGEYVLNVSDLETGFEDQPHRDMIALASHQVDVHGERKGVKRVRVRPYGVPYRCLIPRGWENLLVACRGASFDRTAASSVRLSRTMIWLGHAAGVAAAMASTADVPVGQVDSARLVQSVGMDPASIQHLLTQPRSPAAKEAPTPVIWGSVRHAFVCTDNGHGKILKFDEEGTCVWEFPAPGCQDVWALPNGNILFTHQTREGGGVKEVTPGKDVVFSFRVKGQVHACQRLTDGNTMIGEGGACRVLLVNPAGRVVQETPVLSKVQNPHYHMRHVRFTPGGTILVCHPKESVVREYRVDGTVLREIRGVGRPFTAMRLPGGNTLVGGGAEPIVTEVDAAGRVVWQLRPEDVPEVQLKWAAGLQVLPNGNTVVCNWLGHGQYGKGVPLFEVSRDKRVVWMFTDNRATRSISSVCLLDTPGLR